MVFVDATDCDLAKLTQALWRDLTGQVGVHDLVQCPGMEVVEPAGSTEARLDAPLPHQWGLVGIVEMISECAPGHVLEDEDHLAVAVAVSNEAGCSARGATTSRSVS